MKKPTAASQKGVASARKPRRATVKAAPIRARTVRTLQERKAKAIELCLEAVAGGWTLAKFCRWSHVSKSSILRWMAEDTVKPRFLNAMQVKALALPDEAMELVKLLRRGGEFVQVPDPENPGQFKSEWRPVDAKAIGVAIRHLEFRMMREIKAQYQPSKTVTNVTDVRTLTDEQLDAKIRDLVSEAAARISPTIQ